VSEPVDPHWAGIVGRGTPEEVRAALIEAIEHSRRTSQDVERFRRAADEANARAAALRRELEWMNERHTMRRLLRALRRRLRR
jgi:hypothetical protein